MDSSLSRNESQTTLSRIWTQAADSISYDDISITLSKPLGIIWIGIKVCTYVMSKV